MKRREFLKLVGVATVAPSVLTETEKVNFSHIEISNWQEENKHRKIGGRGLDKSTCFSVQLDMLYGVRIL